MLFVSYVVSEPDTTKKRISDKCGAPGDSVSQPLQLRPSFISRYIWPARVQLITVSSIIMSEIQ